MCLPSRPISASCRALSQLTRLTAPLSQLTRLTAPLSQLPHQPLASQPRPAAAATPPPPAGTHRDGNWMCRLYCQPLQSAAVGSTTDTSSAASSSSTSSTSPCRHPLCTTAAHHPTTCHHLCVTLATLAEPFALYTATDYHLPIIPHAHPLGL